MRSRAVPPVLGAALLALALGLLPPGARAEAPAPAAPAEPSPPPAPPRWGFLVRGGYFGLPDPIADRIFAEHPPVDGWFAGAEIRYHGPDGPRGVASLGLAVDRGSFEAAGLWREDEQDEAVFSAGSIDFTAVTLTAYWSILPSWFLHPYLGLGIGAGYYRGSYVEDGEPITVNTWLPVVTLPLGVTIEIGERLNLAAEVRFIDGISVGGVLQALF